MKKVYCGNCRHYNPAAMYTRESCQPIKGYHDNYIGRQKTHRSPHVLNKNNQCQLYKRKWWKFWISEK